MARKRNRLKSLFGKLTRKMRLQSLIPQLQQTDEFEDLKVSKKEKTDLANGGWTFVVSSNVKAIRLVLVGDKQVLQVMFGDNSIYQWNNRAEMLFKSLLNSVSKGQAIRLLGLYATHSKKVK